MIQTLWFCLNLDLARTLATDIMAGVYSVEFLLDQHISRPTKSQTVMAGLCTVMSSP